MDRAVATEILEAHYPAVVRMSRGLCGYEQASRGVVSFVLPQSLRFLGGWRDSAEGSRWFFHHTVLATRRFARRTPSPQEDWLMVAAGSTDTPYAAFVRALRGLPPQQREAFLLHHGEKLTSRQLGISMDCSVEAADRHLQAATSLLQGAAGPQWEELLRRVIAAYDSLCATTGPAGPVIRRNIDQYLFRRRLVVAAKLAAAAAVVGAAAYVAHRLGLFGRTVSGQ